MWNDAYRRSPERSGEYRCARKGYGKHPTYEDWCVYDAEAGLWKNSRGTVISSVLMWKEEDSVQTGQPGQPENEK